jgi:hypothetical protein
MPVNRQGLFAALTTSPLTGDQFASAIDPIARGAGFTPSRWTFNSQEVLLQPQPLPATAPGETAVLPANVRSRDYMIRGGAWEGFIVVLSRTATAPSLPDVAVRRSLNVFRQNFLNGPDAYTDDVGGTALLGSIRDALTRLGAQWMRLAARGLSNAVSWDRGIPEALPLEAAGGSSPSPSPGGGSASSTAGLGLAIAGVLLLGIALYSQDTMPRARRA